MTKWKNPIVLDFINYHRKEPIEALKYEVEYLLKMTNQLGDDLSVRKGIDIDSIAEFLNLKDEKYKYKDHLQSTAHIIHKSLDDVKIELSKSKSTYTYYRYRFIIAHEIGHWIIRTKARKNFTIEDNKLIEKHRFEEELLCHFFANELLMPSILFEPYFQLKSITESYLEKQHNIFKVPDYQVINRILLANKEYIGIYWKKKKTTTSHIDALRVHSFYPDTRIRNLPFIPINATAKSTRFSPNIIQGCYVEKVSKYGIIFIEDFGDVYGKHEVFVYNPNKVNSIFDDGRYPRKFDLITIMKKHSLTSN